MTRTKKILFSVAALVVLLGSVIAWHLWPSFYPPQHIEVGASVGETVPVDMPLHNSKGEVASIASISGAKGTVLVMTRSADWCPFCKVQLKEHSKIADTLAAKGYALASLSYDEPQLLDEFASELERPFVMLSDKDSAFIDAVGLRDPDYGVDHFAHGVPRPSVLVLDQEGTIKAKLVSDDYRQRPNNEFVLGMVEGIKD